jgi:hypothetical protein
MEQRTAMGKKKYQELCDIGIGGKRGHETLCAYGEDDPQWDDWLEEILARAANLNEVAERVGFSGQLKTGIYLASELGVGFSSESIGRDVCDGYVHVGWIETRKIGAARRAADKQFKQFKKQLCEHLYNDDFSALL